MENIYGVTQGSVIGPMLFILDVNDNNLFVDCDFIKLFADDTLLIGGDCNLVAAIAKMNKTLAEVEEYLGINKLKLKGMTTRHKCIFVDRDKIDLYY